jgi:hypothetical protein
MDTNSKVYQALMMSIINLLEECSELPEIIGINNDLLYKLRKLDAYGQKLITSKADTFLSLSIDNHELQKQINNLNNKIRERELEDLYLTSQAPCKLMRKLFGMHTTEFCLRRKFLGLAGQGQHRPPYCNQETELTIWRYWKETEGLDSRERYLLIAQKTEQPINVIWAAAKRYKEMALSE